MSFIETPDNEWAAEVWPGILQFSEALGLPAYTAHSPPWVVVPLTLTAILDWAYVHRSDQVADYTREHVLLYKNPPHAALNTVFPVGVRVQGFIMRSTLGMLGNWEGTPGTAVSAAQSVALGCGGYREPWHATMLAFRAIEDLVQTSLSSGGFSRPGHRASTRDVVDQELYLTRRVFEKITTRNRGVRLSGYKTGTIHLVTALQSATNGELLEKFRQDDCPGDFVDVCIRFDIVAKREGKRGEMTYHVRYTIQHILLLKSAADLEAELGAPEELRGPLVTVIEQGLSF
ncbi:hypothetical protein B0H10DRAFT_2213700 [Mycena sp. CBHHK59/15]|nr:hypothetical protein B0H10DRAFT_2213700 [Mycena sp. CBHHK59/15]